MLSLSEKSSQPWWKIEKKKKWKEGSKYVKKERKDNLV